MSATKREDWLDALKGFAIICIVLGHVIERAETGIGYVGEPLHFIDVFVNRIHIYIFFITSGYLYGKYDRQKLRNGGYTKTYVRKKVLDLFLPYTYFAVLIWIGKMIFSDYVVRKTSVMDLLMMFINPVAFMWYIYVLFIILMIVFALDKFFNFRNSTIMMITLILLAIEVIINPTYVAIYKTLHNVGVLFLGVILSEKEEILSNRKYLYISGCLTILFGVLSWWFEGRYDIIDVVINYSSAYFFMSLFYIFKDIKCDWVKKLGNETLYIYIMHPIILNLVRMIFMKCKFYNLGVWIAVLLILGIGIPYIYAQIAKRLFILEVPFKPRKYIEKSRKK